MANHNANPAKIHGPVKTMGSIDTTIGDNPTAFFIFTEDLPELHDTLFTI